MADKANIFESLGNLFSLTGAGLIDPAAPYKIQQQRQLAEEQARQQEIQNAVYAKVLGVDLGGLGGASFGSPSPTPSPQDIMSSPVRQPTPEEIQAGMSLASPIDLAPTGLAITGGKLGNLTIGQDPKAAAKLNVATAVETQEEKEKAKDKRTTEGQFKSTQNFFLNYKQSKDEIRKYFPEAGDADLVGFAQRLLASGGAKTGLLPDTKSFIANIDVDANAQARAVEGAKITDQDRTIYAKRLANTVKNPDQTNINLLRDSLIDFHQKGYKDLDKLLSKYEESGDEIFMRVAEETRKRINDLDLDNEFSSMSDEELRKIINGK